MSLKEIKKLVGNKTGGRDVAWITIGSLVFEVKILDVKQAYGRIDVLITPISGQGQRWIQASKLNEIKGGENESI
jgi:hypothetical protein